MKNVLITGASGGLGTDVSLYFAKNGWNVIATMLSFEHGKQLQSLPNIKCYELDVTDTVSIETAKSKIIADFETIDVIINNAGIGYRSFVELSNDEKINEIININWLGVVKVSRAFIPVFRAQNKGQFINISSIAGLVNLPLGSFYHSTKHAVESFSECIAYELSDFNINVCTVQFGNAPTGFQANVRKCEGTSIVSYNLLMSKITDILYKKTNKNKNLTVAITKKLLLIAENPPNNFKRYSIGFDANLMRLLRFTLGYRLFNKVVRVFILR